MAECEKPESKAVYWSCDPDAERLQADTPDEAIEEFLDCVDQEDWPENLMAVGYAPMSVSHHEPNPVRVLDDVLERLDEDYADPDGDPTEPTEIMIAAAKAFCAEVRAHYVPFACQSTGEKVEVNVQAWVREHRPDWLQQKTNPDEWERVDT